MANDLEWIAGSLLLVALGCCLGLALTTLTITRRRTQALIRVADRLDGTGPSPTIRLWDPRLNAAFRRLVGRLETAREQATHDPLTGLLNRQAILSVLDAEIERAARYGRSLSIAFVDVDHFKRVNDTYGHLVGDRVLRHVAEQILANVRVVDRVGRYGGEEFILILPETGVDPAAMMADKLRRKVAAAAVTLDDGQVIAVTMSAGVAGSSGRPLELDPLIRDADAALYAAKGLGRDQVYVFRLPDDDAIVRSAPISMEARRRAVEWGTAALRAANEQLLAVLEGRSSLDAHSSRLIASVASAMARAVGLPDAEVERIRIASMLHDLGELALPEEILSKPADLNPAEWNAVLEHPRIGQVILEQAGALRDAAGVVLHHHEWFDGQGYPYGLAGNEIPIGARIVAIADAYEAMVRGRPYRPAMTHQSALGELEAYAGRQFDPELVAVFGSLFADGIPIPGGSKADVLPDATWARGPGRPRMLGRRRVPIGHDHASHTDDADHADEGDEPVAMPG